MNGQNGQGPVRSSKTSNGLSNIDRHTFIMLFNKDIQKLYIYKKCVKVARAIYVISPAFKDTDILRERLEEIAMSLIDSSTHLQSDALARIGSELLTLQTVITVACDSRRLSQMNGDIILNEIDVLMEEMSVYESPRITLPEAPTLAKLSAFTGTGRTLPAQQSQKISPLFDRSKNSSTHFQSEVGHTESLLSDFDFSHIGLDSLTEKSLPVKDTTTTTSSLPAPVKPRQPKASKPKVASQSKTDRGQAIVSVLKTKGPSFIKDISVMFSDVSEKTIQRELATLVESGQVQKTGDRRWTQYAVTVH
jgi:hypothetical protein